MKKRKRLKCMLIVMLQIGMTCGVTFPCQATEVATEISTEAVTEKSTVVEVEELDMGDYETEMAVGNRQLLSVTVLPLTATDSTVNYTSSNTDVATINGMGRITAVALGTTTIQATCGTINNEFTLTVVESTTESALVAVTDIEVSVDSTDLEVDKTTNITATVLPATATDTDSTVTYTSSNPAVATVSSTGEIKGIAKGTATISITAGGVVRTLDMNIKVATAAININTSCMVLEKGGTYSITASVEPAEAEQALTYKSSDTSIATVSGTGVVTAKGIGSATIIISNGDTTEAATVIVNDGSQNAETKTASENTDQTEKSEPEEQTAALIQQIEDNQTVMVMTSEYSVLSKDVLKKLYDTSGTIVIEDDDYIIQIDGANIVNYENTLSTKLATAEDETGTTFVLNDGQKLPGPVEITLKNQNGKYVYLYNESKEKYQRLDCNVERMKLSSAGKYRITEKKISYLKWNIWFFIGGIIVVVAGITAYIIIKKKYWFW